MNQVKRWLVWLSRIHRCWGFGIQSPTDYWFVRNVVNEHWPYYAYSRFEEKDWLSLKLGQLYFRLANYVQAKCFLEINTQEDDVREYVEAACQKTKSMRLCLPCDKMPEECKTKTLLVRCSYGPGMEGLLHQVVDDCDERSVIVIDDIYGDNEARRFWETLSDDSRVTISYDLYHCGILLKESRHYKKKYYVNF